MVSHLIWSQSEDYIVVEPFAVDSIRIDSTLLLNSLTIKPKTKWGFSLSSNNEYGVFLSRAIDSLILREGNVLKIVKYTNSSTNSGSLATMDIEIYKVDENTFYDLYMLHEKVKKKHKKRLENLPWIMKQSITKYEDGWYKENRFKSWYSIPRDSTTGKYLELGGSAGVDIILALNLHLNAELYLWNSSWFKISLSNKAGIMAVPMGEYSITYTSPGIKIAFPIKNVWLTGTFGKEYLRYHIEDEFYSGRKTDIIDKRIDIGLKFYKSKTKSIEVYYPLRLDDDIIPWWTGGIVFSMNYRI